MLLDVVAKLDIVPLLVTRFPFVVILPFSKVTPPIVFEDPRTESNFAPPTKLTPVDVIPTWFPDPITTLVVALSISVVIVPPFRVTPPT